MTRNDKIEFTKEQANMAFHEADNAWWNLLVGLYGDDAGTLRYTGLARGDEGSNLRVAFDARSKAHNDWLAAVND